MVDASLPGNRVVHNAIYKVAQIYCTIIHNQAYRLDKNNYCIQGFSSLVERESPKLRVGGSIPSSPVFFYL